MRKEYDFDKMKIESFPLFGIRRMRKIAFHIDREPGVEKAAKIIRIWTHYR